jgi:hypothetical protein
MLQAAAASAMPNLNLSEIVLAIGALGTAAYGVVDVSKGFWGGVSNRGFGDVKKVVSQFIPASSGTKGGSALSLTSVLATLRSNWLNGMSLADQKSVAKALIKLNLNAESASGMAAAAGVAEKTPTSIAGKLSTGEALTPIETDAYGRFDLLLTAVLDQGYQRGDQRYRNSAKLLAVPVAVLLALLGAWSISTGALCASDFWRAVVGGLLATPLAPVAKDVASAIQAGTKVAQAWKP